MRIIGGIAGGIKIKAPEGYYVRPTNDLVKESLFNILGDINDKVVVDLFSGSGALGLEALSRGAKKVVFFEKENRGIKTIRANLQAISKNLGENCEQTGRVIIFHDTAINAPLRIPDITEKIDLILADPPYQTAEGEFGALELLQDERIAKWSAGAIIALEHNERTALPWAPHTSWKLIKQRRFGMRCVSFAKNNKKNEN